LGADMAMRAAKQQFGQRDTLASRAQAGHAQDRREAGFAGGDGSDALTAIWHWVLWCIKRAGNSLPYSYPVQLAQALRHVGRRRLRLKDITGLLDPFAAPLY